MCIKYTMNKESTFIFPLVSKTQKQLRWDNTNSREYTSPYIFSHQLNISRSSERGEILEKKQDIYQLKVV